MFFRPMPWFDLMDELEELACDPRWSKAKDIQFLQNALYDQIGATILPGLDDVAE